jgi:site-specific recombinase XerD
LIEEELENDQYVTRWINTITREGTRRVYRNALQLFTKFTGMAPSALVDEALEDLKKDVKERRDVVKQRLTGFYNWLLSEAPRRNTKGEEIGKGLSSKVAHTYTNAVRSFYSTFDIAVKLKGRSKLPRPKVENKRLKLTNLDVKKLLDHCSSARDRCAILLMFQGGLDVSTLCSLKYSDVAPGLEKNEYPLTLHLYRKKSGTEFVTFIGRDGIQSIRAYLNILKARGIELRSEDPLFVQMKKGKRIEPMRPALIQKMMRELAVKVGLVNGKNNSKQNPISPHALRKSFSSILVSHGVASSVVDHLLGHSTSELNEAYQTVQLEDLKKIYREVEPYLSVSMGEDLTKLKEIEEREKEVQRIINGLVSENMILKQELGEHKKALEELKSAVAELRKLLGGG